MIHLVLLWFVAIFVISDIVKWDEEHEWEYEWEDWSEEEEEAEE